jgi:hypothetical protein
MAGPAGNSDYYTLYAYDHSKNRVDKSVEIQLVRVTSVIKDTLAKGQLVDWAYRHTRDVVSGLVSTLIDGGVDVSEITDLLTDADWLEEYLKENQLRPDDIKEEAGELGTEKHALLEKLGKLALGNYEDEDMAYARSVLDKTEDGHEYAIAEWWVRNDPLVVASEKTLVSMKHGFAGTVDLVWVTGEEPGRLTITDLKNRKADRLCGVNHKTEAAALRCHVGTPYESDFIQVGAYDIAWREGQPHMPPDRRTVLVAKADGSYVEEESEYDSSIFLDLLSVWKKMREVGR